MKISRLWLLALLALPFARVLAQQPVVATLSIVRQVEVTSTPVAVGKVYGPAVQHQGLRNGYGVRTLKRAQAELKFKDNSLLRLNERTTLVVEDAVQMRKISLTEGAVWVKVAKGVHTTVETPTATATAKGTQFLVLLTDTGATRVVVLEGRVEVGTPGGTVDVGAGQYTETAPPPKGTANGSTGSTGTNPPPPAAAQTISAADLPEDQGGTVAGWWADSNVSGGVSVTAGTPVAQDIRESPVSEDGVVAASQPPTTPGMPAYAGYIEDDASRNAFLNVAQRVLTPAIYGANQDATSYKQAHNTDALTTLPGLTAADLSALSALGITDVGTFVQGLLDNGGAVDVALNPLTSRGALRPKAITVAPSQRELLLLDQTRSSAGIFFGGLALGLAADWGHWSMSRPDYGAMLYGFSGRPGFWGARADITGLIGKTRYAFEANALDLINDPSHDLVTRLTSVAEVEHPVNKDLTLFAGRRRFYHGPVFQDLMNTQLIANRYSSIGMDYTRGPWSFEGAWLYDSNPDVTDAQPGALASLELKAGGGIFGLHALRETQVHDGNGLTASASIPLVRNVVDGYTEVGWQVDEMLVQTYGLYLPWLYQKTDVDVFLEYGRHAAVGQGVSAIASHKLGEMTELRAFANWADDFVSHHKATVVGVGVLLSYDSTKQGGLLANGVNTQRTGELWRAAMAWVEKHQVDVDTQTQYASLFDEGNPVSYAKQHALISYHGNPYYPFTRETPALRAKGIHEWKAIPGADTFVWPR